MCELNSVERKNELERGAFQNQGSRVESAVQTAAEGSRAATSMSVQIGTMILEPRSHTLKWARESLFALTSLNPAYPFLFFFFKLIFSYKLTNYS